MTHPSSPIFLVGFSGSGKSSAARKISAILHGSYIDIDQLIEKKSNKSINDIFTQEGEDSFRKYEHEMLHDPSLLEHTIIATGGGCPCFFDNMQYMNNHGITVYLKAPASVLANRIKHRKAARPLFSNIPDEQLIEKIEPLLLQREMIYNTAKIIFPAINFNPYQLLHIIENI